MAVMAGFKRGKPIMQDFDAGSTTYSAGDVVVIGNAPFVAHEAIPAFTGGATRDALACRGGIYTMTADVNTYPVGTYVYWDPTANKVTAGSSASCVPFGWIVGLATGRLDDTAVSTTVDVLHDPSDDSGQVLNLGATANDNITNTNAETAFATTAVIPASSLVAGDVIHVRAFGVVNGQNSTNTNTVQLKISTAANTFTAVVNTGAINAAANAVFLIDTDIIFTAVGNSGSFYATGDSAFGAAPTRAGFTKGATSINTGLAVTIEVTDTQSAASTSNVTQLLELLVEKKRK